MLRIYSCADPPLTHASGDVHKPISEGSDEVTLFTVQKPSTAAAAPQNTYDSRLCLSLLLLPAPAHNEAGANAAAADGEHRDDRDDDSRAASALASRQRRVFARERILHVA